MKIDPVMDIERRRGGSTTTHCVVVDTIKQFPIQSSRSTVSTFTFYSQVFVFNFFQQTI